MIQRYKRLIFIISAFSIPLLTIASPSWLNLQGVQPLWAILWLLPWSLRNSPSFGAFAGLCIGLILDAISVNGATQVPALIMLGIWWGRIGKKGAPIQLSLNLGLLAWIGSIVFGLSIGIQVYFLQGFGLSNWFNAWAFHTLLAQSIITGLMAPLISSWLFLAGKTNISPISR